MSAYLFLVTLGPIQDFIAAARRTRDLWAGSQLLSNLSRDAAQYLRDQQAELIFPAQDDLQSHEVVNRILAVTPRSPAEIGPQLETYLQARLREHARNIFLTVPGIGKHQLLAPALEQLDDLLEIYWAGVARTASYKADREHVEAALAARKNTRAFRQPTFSAMVPKSSIEGTRESLIPEQLYPRRNEDDPTRQRKIDALFKLFGAGQAERLSGVDLLKRHTKGADGDGASDFPSTSHFAALPLIARRYAEGRETRYRFHSYETALKKGFAERNQRLEQLLLHQRFRLPQWPNNYDASILFPGRLEEELDGEALASARQALTAYLCNGLAGEPEPYYALLHADGDNMGKVLDQQTEGGIEQHQAFSRALDHFADGVRAIVEGEHYRGALVYAGGDDVLAFLPLDTVLECAKVLAESFAGQLAAYKGKEGERATLSVGIAICHHLEPLSDALELAREAEKYAKKLKGKNALAITLSKRSGADTTIRGGWQDGFPERLERCIKSHQADLFPDGAAFELRDLDERVGRVLDSEAFIAEAMRILTRKRAQRGSAAISDEQLAAIRQSLELGASQRRPDGRPQWGVNELADELIVAREFARARGIMRNQGRPTL